MVRFQTLAGALLSLSASVYAAPQQSTPSVKTPPASATATTTNVAVATAPCALAASAQAQYFSAVPNAKHAEIPAKIAYDCLETIPNKKAPALDLLYALQPLFEFQSTFSYLKNPPEGYLFPALDFWAGFDKIVSNVQYGAYNSEYDFQTDITALTALARDGHFTFSGDATQLFVFKRQTPVVSVSMDGFALPQIYALEDLVSESLNADESVTFFPRNASYTPSPITSIDGIDVVTFMVATSLILNIQDPDASYNNVFFELAQFTILPGNTGVFSFPQFYPGANTTLTFANGSSAAIPNDALVLEDLSSITNGADMYSAFCAPKPISSAAATSSAAISSNQKRQASSGLPSSTASVAPVPTSPGYPYPVVKHSANLVAGYFLNGTGNDNVAVLSIPSYNGALPGQELEFQNVVQSFLAAAQQAGRTKLIIDLQANGGGIVDLGLDTFAQLFPSKRPNTQGNMVSNVGQDIIGQTFSNIEAGDQTQAAKNADLAQAWTVQADMTVDGKGFASWDDFIGPVQVHGGNFTKLFQLNYSNEALTDNSKGKIVITGTNNRTDFSQVFNASDMIMLYDGYCASTCTVFSELMKTLGGVQSIAVGGRPQLAAMQGVGGVKGSNVQEMETMIGIAGEVFQIGNQSVLAEAQDTVFMNISELPLERASSPAQAGSVNFRNNIRIGDNSATPLQFVYEAADCRIWYTPEMIYDPTFLWSRVASIAFASNYTYGTPYTSPYCVHGSTNQPTSLTGGLKNGTLGPQTPPFGAKSTLEGWLINGTTLTNSTDSSPAGTHSVSGASPSSTATGTGAGTGTGTGTGTGSATASSSAQGAAVRWSGSPNWLANIALVIGAVVVVFGVI